MAVVRERLHKSGENRLGSGQREMRHRELATEKRCLQPNEMKKSLDMFQRIMAIWLTKLLKRVTNSGKAVTRGKRVNRGAGNSMRISFYRR